MILWRISEHAALDGAGGLVVAGRWHSRGRPIIYAAESSALAMLEILVHLEVARPPPSFQLLRIEGPDELAVEPWPADDPPDDLDETRAWGDAWLAGGRTALARVPSAVAPGAWNMLINPVHLEAGRIKVTKASRWPLGPTAVRIGKGRPGFHRTAPRLRE